MSIFNSTRYERYKKFAKTWVPMNDAMLSKASDRMGTAHQKYVEDFVFIHINKCGGTSMERALGIPLLNHDTALDRKRKLGDRRWHSRYKFALVRHPYDRLVSLFFYSHRRQNMTADALSARFPRWLDEIAELNLSGKAIKNVAPQWSWVSDNSGKLLLDDLFKLEEIDSRLPELNAHLGKRLRLKRLKKGTTDAVKPDLLDEQSKNIIHEVYKVDFNRLNYHR